MPRANRRRGRLWRQHRAACSRGLTLVRLLFYAWLCRNRIVLGLPAFAGPCIRDSKHPWVAFFHIFFRSLALFAYGFGTYFSSNFVLIFVCCILLSICLFALIFSANDCRTRDVTAKRQLYTTSVRLYSTPTSRCWLVDWAFTCNSHAVPL